MMRTHDPLCDMCGYIMPDEKWAWITIKRNFVNHPLTLCRECCDKLKELIEKRNAKDALKWKKWKTKGANYGSTQESKSAGVTGGSPGAA